MRWLSLLLLACVACGDSNDEQPRAVIVNGFETFTIVTARYADAAFDTPLVPGTASDDKRVRSGLRLGYALAVDNWNGEGAAPAGQVFRTLSGLDATADHTITVEFDEGSTYSKCAGMERDEYDLINTTFFAETYNVAAYDDVVCP
jgi:hypothetical protein